MKVKPIVYAACDLEYFKQHGLAFMKSAAMNGMVSFVQIIPTRNHPIEVQSEILKKYMKDVFAKSLSLEEKKFIIVPELLEKYYDVPFDEERTYFSVVRFLEVGSLIRKWNAPFLVLDIDSIIQKEVTFDISVETGIYLREDNTVGANEHEIEGMKVAAGCLYVTPLSLTFLDRVKNNILSEPLRWFCDQKAIYYAYLKHKEGNNFFDLSKTNLLDWQFRDDSLVWTAKGKLKYTSEIYAKRKKDVETLQDN